jgi:hypothetical protein
MAANVQPTKYFGAGYAVDPVNHLVKFNTNDAASNKILSQLTDAQANASTGDARQIILAMLEACYQAYVAQVNANNKPKQMSLQRIVSTDSSGNLTITITGTFVFSASGTWTMVAET